MNRENCLICFDKQTDIQYVKNCVNCKFMYCVECANKLNHNCAICLRGKQSNDHILSDEFEYNLFMCFLLHISDCIYYMLFFIILFPFFICCILYSNTIFNVKKC